MEMDPVFLSDVDDTLFRPISTANNYRFDCTIDDLGSVASKDSFPMEFYMETVDIMSKQELDVSQDTTVHPLSFEEISRAVDDQLQLDADGVVGDSFDTLGEVNPINVRNVKQCGVGLMDESEASILEVLAVQRAEMNCSAKPVDAKVQKRKLEWEKGMIEASYEYETLNEPCLGCFLTKEVPLLPTTNSTKPYKAMKLTTFDFVEDMVTLPPRQKKRRLGERETLSLSPVKIRLPLRELREQRAQASGNMSNTTMTPKTTAKTITLRRPYFYHHYHFQSEEEDEDEAGFVVPRKNPPRRARKRLDEGFSYDEDTSDQRENLRNLINLPHKLI